LDRDHDDKMQNFSSLEIFFVQRLVVLSTRNGPLSGELMLLLLCRTRIMGPYAGFLSDFLNTLAFSDRIDQCGHKRLPQGGLLQTTDGHFTA
jgi:hypothetical protein